MAASLLRAEYGVPCPDDFLMGLLRAGSWAFCQPGTRPFCHGFSLKRWQFMVKQASKDSGILTLTLCSFLYLVACLL